MIKRFREGAEALPDATVVFNSDFSIVWCNKLAQQLLGLKWPRDKGQRLSNLIRSPDFIAHLNDGDFSEPVNIPSPLNKKVILEIRIMPYADGQMLLMARDVSKIKQLENMRQDFVANVSHELRTPLTVLQGYLEMMEDPEAMPPAMMVKARDMMAEQTIRMRALIEQLLTISRLESRGENV
ncbi:MAG: PAS domain-containing protein, partial [Cohaesibacter sp.]|nr:PAS domain-containing protein [Cohaesibacter sp.]